ncbi:MAG: CoA pyrophosphatase [Nocardioides sp.]|jgi:8-oxo-dGTP pyrophosphatase MutT (NUDIX family)
MSIPAWLGPIQDGLDRITGADLTRFLPPEDFEGRTGAVLLLFGGETREEAYVLLTERAHDMRSHPGQVSFPGGSIDEGETAQQAALREAEEETGVRTDGIEILGALPQLWLPPANFAVTPVVGWWREPSPVSVVDPAEVHAIYLSPVDELLDPTHRITVRHPRAPGYTSPAFLIGDDKDLILWGFTAGIIARLFDFIGWTRAWDDTVVRELPDHMFQR